jgi:hypothetical protein
MRTRSLLPALFLAASAAACTEGRIANELPTAAADGGAVVLGTVVKAGADAQTPRSGLTVHAVETGSATATDPSGKFVLGGLPSGTVTLRFRGADCDAALQLSGLVSGRSLTIRVRVAGSSASLQD